MRKYVIFVFSFLSFHFFVNAQMTDSIAWRKVDSVNKIIKSAKGKKLVDCYNMLAECYLWIWDVNDKHLDTACMYANTAYEDATKLIYKAGVGYAKASIFAIVREISDALA